MRKGKDKAKQSKIKPNTKKALNYLKSKNPNLNYLINAFNLEIKQSIQNS